MGKVIDIIKKHGITAFGTFIAADGYRRSVFSQHKEIKNLIAKTEAEKAELQKKILDLEITNETHRQSLDLKSLEIKEANIEINRVWNKINNIKSELSSGSYQPGNTKEILESDLNGYQEQLTNLNKIQTQEISNLTDLIGKGTNKSSILGDWDGYLEWYKAMVSSLEPDQLVALANIFGFYLLLTTLYSMGIIYIGNNLIDKWELEKKYPKLSKYIQYKNKVNKYTMRFYFISLFVTVLIWLCLNIYMFSLKFFI